MLYPTLGEAGVVYGGGGTARSAPHGELTSTAQYMEQGPEDEAALWATRVDERDRRRSSLPAPTRAGRSRADVARGFCGRCAGAENSPTSADILESRQRSALGPRTSTCWAPLAAFGTHQTHHSLHQPPLSSDAQHPPWTRNSARRHRRVLRRRQLFARSHPHRKCSRRSLSASSLRYAGIGAASSSSPTVRLCQPQ